MEYSQSLWGEDKLVTCSLINAEARSGFLPRLTANSSTKASASHQASNHGESLTSLILILPGLSMHQKLNKCVGRFPNELEKDKTNAEWLRGSNGQLGVETKGGIQRLIVDEHGEDEKSEEEVDLSTKEKFGGMSCGRVRDCRRHIEKETLTVIPVAEFVALRDNY